ncbi:MAG: AsmA-like C-terminal domain-containing protein, partial [Desulfobacterales bacterium]
RERIQTKASEAISGELQYERLELSFLPRPQVVIRKCHFSIPHKASGTLTSFTIYPKILPLLFGKLKSSGIHLHSPDVKIQLGEKMESGAENRKHFSLGGVKDKVDPILGLVSSKARGLAIRVNNGRLNLFKEKEIFFWFQDIDARFDFSTEDINLDFSCKSSLWEDIFITGTIDPKDLIIRTNIDLNQIKTQVLTEYIYSRISTKVKASPLNLKINFISEGFTALQGELNASIPSLTLQHEKEEITIKGTRLKGKIDVSETKSTFTLGELKSDNPQLNIAGELSLSRLAKPHTLMTGLILKSKDVDVHTTRKIGLALAGNIPAVADVFAIVKGGRLPYFTYAANGNSFKDLGDLKNINITGAMRDGKIFIPVVDLSLEDVDGEVAISKGILEGRDLRASLGNTSATSGKLTLGLDREHAPFRLDLAVEADLSQLPPILKRLIANEYFQKELALISNVQGNAVGRLYLGDHIESIRAMVEVSQLNMTASYQRIPYPLTISKGQYTFKGAMSAVKNLQGHLGKTRFNNVSGKIDWEKTPYLEVNSGELQIYPEEIYPWLVSFEGLNSHLEHIKSIEGVLEVSTLNLKGPLSDLRKLQYQIAGEVRHLALKSSHLPEIVQASTGNFKLTQNLIFIKDFETKMLDASLRISGHLNDYLQGFPTIDLNLDGKIGLAAIQWISGVVDLPSAFNLASPLSISEANLTRNRGKETAFSGNFAMQEGLNISTEILLNAQQVLIKKLSIQDETSSAAFSLIADKRGLDLSFIGNLDKTTLDHIIKENKILSGQIKGDFHAHIFLDQLFGSKFQGKLLVSGLTLPEQQGLPVEINRLSAEAEGDKVHIKSAKLSIADNLLFLKGDANFSTNKMLLDMDLSADDIDLNKLNMIADRGKKEAKKVNLDRFWNYPARGIIRVRIKNVKYKEFNSFPLHADVSLGNKNATIDVKESNFCGISLSGVSNMSPEAIKLEIKPVVKNQKLNPTVYCLLDKSISVEGNFNLEGELEAQGKAGEIVNALNGPLVIDADEGSFYAGNFFRMLTKIFDLLNVTEWFKGKLPDLRAEGFSYHSIKVKANIESRKLIINEMIIDGTSMEIVGHGNIDLISQKVDALLLVAPFKTIDLVIKKIPLVKDILKGSLISVPFKIKGDRKNPKVIPLSLDAVGSGQLGIMKRTLQVPVKVIQPILSGEKNN